MNDEGVEKKIDIRDNFREIEFNIIPLYDDKEVSKSVIIDFGFDSSDGGSKVSCSSSDSIDIRFSNLNEVFDNYGRFEIFSSV